MIAFCIPFCLDISWNEKNSTLSTFFMRELTGEGEGRHIKDESSIQTQYNFIQIVYVSYFERSL